jgi:hypothetical protein
MRNFREIFQKFNGFNLNLQKQQQQARVKSEGKKIENTHENFHSGDDVKRRAKKGTSQGK